MTDKKLTDKEIIKALECLAGELIPCKDCPYSVNYTHFDCKRQVAKDALDLINRQQAEIERLQSILLCFMDEVSKWENKHGLDVSELPLIPIKGESEKITSQIKSEAFKEFAEKLKNITTSIVLSGGKYKYDVVTTQGIDYVLKERVGDTE